MNILEDINEVLKALGIPIETGVFKSEAPDTYIVLVPLTDTFHSTQMICRRLICKNCA